MDAEIVAAPGEPASDIASVAPRLASGGLSVVDRFATDVPEVLAPHWQALAEDAAEPNCFAEPWFVAAGIRAFAGRDEVRLLEVWEDGGLVGVLPVHISRDYGRTRVRHVQNWRHHHDFLGTPLIRAGHEEAFWGAILAHLDAADWAPGFLHVTALVEGGPVHSGLAAAAGALGRGAPAVHRSIRAALESSLSSQAYFESSIRKKKRKELKRLQNRLADIGPVTFSKFGPADNLSAWCDTFLALERCGWKGEAGSALACAPKTEAFFRDAIEGAAAAGRLELLRMDVAGAPVAMLVNFLVSPGSFSFKIAFDQTYARFSPGVLIQLENLRILDRPDIAWMDSCAAENHPMIDSLWSERRSIIRVTVRLGGARRGLVYGACRILEILSAAARRLSSHSR